MTEMKQLTQHVNDAAKRVGETLVRMHDIETRILVLESKTHGLSTRPNPRNCNNPQCGRIMRGVQNRCSVCGKDQ